jgi:hypothetical protein
VDLALSFVRSDNLPEAIGWNPRHQYDWEDLRVFSSLGVLWVEWPWHHHARNIVETFWEHLKCDWSIAGGHMQAKLVDNIPNMLNFYSVITLQELCTKAHHVLNMYSPIPGPFAPSAVNLSSQEQASRSKRLPWEYC